MAVPTITNEERSQALEIAMHARKVRANIKAQLQSGELTFAEVMERKDEPDLCRMRTISLLTAMPGIGKSKAQRIMKEVGIAETRRLKGLGKHQIEQLNKLFESK